MVNSVRVRLTLWYTGVLALLLIFLSLGTYWLVALTMDRRTYISMAEISQGFLATLQSEYKNQSKEKAGTEALRAAAVEAGNEFRLRDHRFAVLDSSGTVLAENKALPIPQDPNWAASQSEIPAEILRYLEGRRQPRASQTSQPEISAEVLHDLITGAATAPRRLQELMLGGEAFRARVLQGEVGGSAINIVTLQSVEAERLLLDDIRQTLFWMIPIMLLIASAGGYFLARKSLAPVEAMSEKAAQMGAQNLNERLPVQNPRDELGRLASTFNDLLERLNRSFEQQRRFMADASHELRSPVSIIRGEAEVALSQARSPREYRESLAISLEEARRLSQIVDDLLTLARADAGQYPLHPRDFYLEELAGDCLRSARSMAAARGITLHYEPDGEMPIHADQGLLQRLVMNLLDNAIKYTPAAGTVHVACERSGEEYALTVRDSGSGIPAEAREKIFERFFRLDPARTQERRDLGTLDLAAAAASGAGLGLAIARWIADAHEGRLVLLQSDASGSTFALFLPANRSASAETKGAARVQRESHTEATRA
jgi:two-component system, OmpR family, sensor kinase